MDTLFHRLLDRAVSATVRVSSPLIAPIPITHSLTIPRAVVTGGHVALWIALPAQGAPFPRNKVDGWGFDGKKKRRGKEVVSSNQGDGRFTSPPSSRRTS